MMHCNICDEDYSNAAVGGPGICPSCDCGVPVKQKKLQRTVNELIVKNVGLSIDGAILDYIAERYVGPCFRDEQVPEKTIIRIAIPHGTRCDVDLRDTLRRAMALDGVLPFDETVRPLSRAEPKGENNG